MHLMHINGSQSVTATTFPPVQAKTNEVRHRRLVVSYYLRIHCNPAFHTCFHPPSAASVSKLFPQVVTGFPSMHLKFVEKHERQKSSY